MEKLLLREKYRRLRKQLPLEALEELSISIANNLIHLDIWNYQFYHIFLSIEAQKEVNTEPILSILSGMDKNIVIAKSNFSNYSMTNYLLTDNTRIVTNAYGIPEPDNGIAIPNQDIQVVFIPLLAYDNQGNRVGYGKGFYDTFLNQCNPNVLKIGLSFFDAEPLISDIREADVKLDYCITPQKTMSFK